jgi:dimeric dUTPase (all-alpha-NTP-PPase superfamily)
MTNEQLRMQMLSGIITEGEYKAKLEENKKSTKKSLKENFVGMGAINNPFIEREKTGYETAFEHFLGQKYELNEEMEEVEVEEVKKNSI